MGNMNYCRFENTSHDLQDCLDHMDESDLGESEIRARKHIIVLCVDIALDYGKEVGKEIQEMED
jgi:hypothetical protein